MRRSPHDREILGIALPALGALAAEPLYLLVDIVFALDGVLIGAGDTRYLAATMVLAGFGVYVPVALAALHLDWGIAGVWAGLLALMAVRLLTLGARFVSRRWAIGGAVVARRPAHASPARSR